MHISVASFLAGASHTPVFEFQTFLNDSLL